MSSDIRLNEQKNTLKIKQVNPVIKLTQKTPTIVIKESGTPGKPGEDGIKGDPGYGIPTGGLENEILIKGSDTDYDFIWASPSDIDKNFVQNFTVTDIIIVEHNLNKYPSVSVIDSAGDEVEGDIFYNSVSQLTVQFANTFSGKIICN